MRTLITGFIFVGLALAQSAIPEDHRSRSFSCSTQQMAVTDKAGAKHYRYRAFLHGVRTDGDKWEHKLGLRPTEKQATKDCQLWQEMTAAKKRQTSATP